MEMPAIEWPEWSLEVPSNKQFLPYKQRCIDDVMSRLETYVQTLCNLPGLKERDDISGVIWYCLREFCSHFWDLPASRDYHHNGRWGLFHHSLDVAFRRTVEASQHTAIDSQGKPSAEAAWKYRGESVLVAWITGLFHDCGKIFDVRVVYKPNRFEPGKTEYGKRVYHSLMGGLLGFKLKHPEKYLVYEWTKNRGMRHVRLNPGMFVILLGNVAVRLMQSLNHEQIVNLFESLMSDGDYADNESVAESRKQEDDDYIGQAIKLFARDNFKAKDNRGSNQIRVFYLGHNTYICINPLAFQVIANYIKKDLQVSKYDKDSIINYLTQQGYVYSSGKEGGSGKYFSYESFVINDSVIKSYVSFLNGDLLSDVDVSTVPVVKLKYDDEAPERIKEILGSYPPNSWFYEYSEQEDDSQSETDTGASNSERVTDEQDSESSSDNENVDSTPSTLTGESAPEEGEEAPQGKEAEEESADSGDSGETVSQESSDSAEPQKGEEERKDPGAGAGAGAGAGEENSAGSEVQAEQSADSSAASKAMKNLIKKLSNEELVFDDPEDEGNIGYRSISDGNIWAIYPKIIEETFYNAGTTYRRDCLVSLHEKGYLKLNGEKYIVSGSTMYHNKGPKNAPQDKYIILELSQITHDFPEIGEYL